MFKRVVFGLGLVMLLAGFVSQLWASDATFPFGMYVSDYNPPYLSRPTWLAALRWQGISVGAAGGNVSDCRQRLATYDSVGYRIWLMAHPFILSTPNPPYKQNLDITGRDPNAPLIWEYFTSYSRDSSARDPSKYRSSAQFDAYLDSLMNAVVDSVKPYHALWKYFIWDEPNNFHSDTANLHDPSRRYWENIWWGTDPTCSQTDSLGVFSWVKWKIEHRDSLHSVLMDLGYNPYSAAYSLCTIKYNFPRPDTHCTNNYMQGISFSDAPFGMTTPIGDSSSLAYFTSAADTEVDAAQKASPADPLPVYDSNLQEYGLCNTDTISKYPNSQRIPIPEEVREEANLAILHQVKGLSYFILKSYLYTPHCHLWDENLVPFDTLYKEYVYQRNHSLYLSPDSLKPFWGYTDSIHDPFRTLGTKPNPYSSAKGWENYYKWKYAPYARNWDSLKSINNELHIIAPHLRYLWRVGQRITSVVPDAGTSARPEYVTFADSTQGHNPTAFYAFLVSKDFNSPQQGYLVSVNASKLPPPGVSRYYVLDLNSRHLIPYTGSIVFHTVLKPGEGRLFRFIIGPPPPGEGMGALAASAAPNPYNGSMWNTLLVTDPDLSFQKYPTGGFPPNVQFTEGDTVVLSAKVYNLGFANQTDSVLFYQGDPLAGGTPLGGSYVTVPGLSTTDTLVKTVTVNVNWITNSSTAPTALGPHDINVILKGAASSAHSLLWLNAQDYATTVNLSPWNMDETKPNQDIVSSPHFMNLTDSISSCWEGTTNNMPPFKNPELHFRLASSIDASKYKVLTFRIFSDQADSVKVRWSPQQPGGTPGWTLLPAYQWQVVTVNLGGFLSWGGSVTDFYLQFPTTANRKIRLAWAKLTMR